MPLTEYTNRKLTSYLFGKVKFDPPDVLYIALSNTNQNFVEPIDPSYSRVAVNNNSDNWVAAQDLMGQQNNIIITFPKAEGPWGEIKAFGIYDQFIDGNLIGSEELDPPQTITNGDIASFPIASLIVALL